MSDSSKTILVLGATGQQGGSTARALRRDGWRVRALLRDSKGEKARVLRDLGIETVAGDLRDPASIAAAMGGVYGVFSMQPSSGQPEYGVTDAEEIIFGRSVAEAARQEGVEHFVYSSVAGTGPGVEVGHFASKWRIEESVRSLQLDWTILRPAAFMEILSLPGFGLADGKLTFFSQPKQPMQFIAVEDIGRIAARVFAGRNDFRGRTFDIAGDSLTGEELATKIGAAIGRPISYRRFPDAILREAPLLARLVRLVDAGPAAGQADLDALRRLEPALLSFDDWLRRTGESLLKAL